MLLSHDATRRLLLTLAFVVALMAVSYALRWALGRVRGRPDPRGGDEGANRSERLAFWTAQGVQLLTLVVLVAGVVSIWLDDPRRVAGAAGLVTAGLAVALQRVITAFAAYLIILRGKVFTVGDRITMAEVRGDVVALGFMQTTVMEMGQAPGEQGDSPSVWVGGRQYTGRLVRITNDKIFDSPVFNYTREFPYVWDEIRLPVSYKDDRRRAEAILLDVGRRHTGEMARRAEEAYAALRRKFPPLAPAELAPRVYWRLTDNWLELSLRFVAEPRGVRALKDAMYRDILEGLDDAGIGIASGTYEIVGVPPIRIVQEGKGVIRDT